MDEKETPRVSEGDAAPQTEGGAQSGERGSERPLEAAIIEALGFPGDGPLRRGGHGARFVRPLQRARRR